MRNGHRKCFTLEFSVRLFRFPTSAAFLSVSCDTDKFVIALSSFLRIRNEIQSSSLRYQISEICHEELGGFRHVQSVGSESKWCQQLVSDNRDSTESVADDVLKRFNRDTHFVAAGVFGVLLLTAWAFVVLVPERHPVTPGLSWSASQTKSGSSPPADDATLFRSAHVSTKRASSAVTAAALLLADQGSTASFSKENPGWTEAAETSIPSPAKPQGWTTFSNLHKRKNAAFISGSRNWLPRRHPIWP